MKGNGMRNRRPRQRAHSPHVRSVCAESALCQQTPAPTAAAEASRTAHWLQVEKIGTHPPSGDALIADVNSMVLKNVVPMPASAAAAGSAGEPATQPAAAHAQKSKLSVVEREETLHKLASQGWLFMAREGYYTLGVSSASGRMNVDVFLILEHIGIHARVP